MFGAVRVTADYSVEVIIKAYLGIMVCILTVQTGIIAPKVQNRESSLTGFLQLLLVGFVMFHSLPAELSFMFFLFKLLPEIIRYTVGDAVIR